MAFKLFTFLFVLSLLCISGCKDSSTNPPAGYITRLTKILDKPGYIMSAEMSQDKRSIIYSYKPSLFGETELRMCDTDGSNDSLLFNTLEIMREVVQSPDSKSLMITTFNQWTTNFYHYSLINGTNYLWHSLSYPDEDYFSLGFTGDGKNLIATSSGLSAIISSINIQTKEVTVLSETSLSLGVSNSGSKIAYLQEGIGLHLMNSDGSNKKLLLDLGWFGTVAFTSNDNIFYYAAVDYTPEIHRNKLYKLDANTGSAHKLMEDDTTGGNYQLHDASYFDGSLLATYSNSSGEQIVMINKGGNYHPLIDDPRRQIAVGFTSFPRQAIIRIMDEDLKYNLYLAEF